MSFDFCYEISPVVWFNTKYDYEPERMNPMVVVFIGAAVVRCWMMDFGLWTSLQSWASVPRTVIEKDLSVMITLSEFKLN
jgi:hypothetical protein